MDFQRRQSLSKYKNYNFKGKVRINAHFFEEGNVEFKDIKNFNEKVVLKGNPVDDAKVVL